MFLNSINLKNKSRVQDPEISVFFLCFVSLTTFSIKILFCSDNWKRVFSLSIIFISNSSNSLNWGDRNCFYGIAYALPLKELIKVEVYFWYALKIKINLNMFHKLVLVFFHVTLSYCRRPANLRSFSSSLECKPIWTLQKEI